LFWRKVDRGARGYEFRLVCGRDGRRRWFVDGRPVAALMVANALGADLLDCAPWVRPWRARLAVIEGGRS
jgi:hypothetical protein